ncbi:5,6-dimethylbenzimidazole synthase [uncultured Pelagimonas sp.]|uniref:5,6-dimethylbenzimidazole synthase n=1 Tax=uncultured Pelagimonas sp. TaxID=1618102 RepID=UPI0026033FDE|nr:5,6-dimethylbenzimidazole synthase [uncultured Pelagimonas sp.]
MKFETAHSQTLRDLLTWRRDTRHFRPDAVSQDALQELQSAMELAPSVGNARPWRVLSVTSPEKRSQVRSEFQRCNAVAETQYDDEAKAEYRKLKLAGLDIAPVQLAVFTDTAPNEGRGLGRRSMPQTLEQSTAMAIFSLWLMARSHNLGVGMVSILDPKKIEAIFDAPDNWRFSAYLCIGHPSFLDDTPLLHKVGWQKNTDTVWAEV